MRQSTVRLLALAFALGFIFQATKSTAASSAAPTKWAVLTFDTTQTMIVYDLTGWPHVTHGTFKLRQGIIRVNPANGEMAGEIVIDAASGGSGHSTRDARMRDSILEVQRYPDISFAPQQVESHGSPPGVFPVTVRGVMVLHGGQHPLTISAQVGQNGDSVNIQCSFVVPYVAWGLKDPSLLFFKVAKEVGVQVSAVAHLTWILVPAPGHEVQRP